MFADITNNLLSKNKRRSKTLEKDRIKRHHRMNETAIIKNFYNQLRNFFKIPGFWIEYNFCLNFQTDFKDTFKKVIIKIGIIFLSSIIDKSTSLAKHNFFILT